MSSSSSSFSLKSALFQQVHCARCDYDLRMTLVEGTCPECGLSVTDSLQAQQGAPSLWYRCGRNAVIAAALALAAFDGWMHLVEPELGHYAQLGEMLFLANELIFLAGLGVIVAFVPARRNPWLWGALGLQGWAWAQWAFFVHALGVQ